MSRKFTMEFCDELVRRLRAGDSPESLREELSIGSATMTRYIQIARGRNGKIGTIG